MVSQRDLGRQFRNGATTGKASNVEIRETDNGGAILVGYGHAVYAYRSPTGHITTYAGWYDGIPSRGNSGTMSTKCQYSKLGVKPESGNVDETIASSDGIDSAPKSARFTPPQLA